MPKPVTEFDRMVRTVCSPNCMGTCGVNAYVKDDRIVRLEPASFPDPGYERICLKGIAMATQRVDHEDRLLYPLIREGERGEGRWRRASWEEVYDYIAPRMQRIADEHGWRANSWHNASGNYGFRAFTSAKRVCNTLGGSHFGSGAMSGDWAGMTAYLAALGVICSSNEISDLPNARYMLNIGKNVADTGHSEMHFIFDAMEQGCKVTYVDPRFSRSAAKADEWLPVRPGTDAALALGLIHIVVRDGHVKRDYVARHTNLSFLIRDASGVLLRERDIKADGGDGYMVWDEACGAPCLATDAAAPQLSGSWTVTSHDGQTLACRTAFDASWEVWREYTPERAAEICGIPVRQIQQVAHDYTTLDPAWIWVGLGPQRYVHGHLVHRAFITLAALCGNIGKAYAGVSFVDGPIMAIYANPPLNWTQPGGNKGTDLQGIRLVDIIANDDPYPVRSLWITQSGFASQSPYFERFVREALPKLDLYVVSEQIMTEAASYADVVLPVVSYFEEDWDLVANGENWFVQLRRRAVPPRGEARSDFNIFQGLCQRLGRGAEHWDIEPREACRRILAEHPDPRFSQIDFAELEKNGVARLVMEKPYVPHQDMKFRTPSGRIELYQEQFADLGEATLVYREPEEGHRSEKAKRFPLTLITYKHVHSVHGTHLMLPYIREMLPGPRVEIAPDDAARRGIADGDEVEVFNDRGSFRVSAMVSSTVPVGTLGMTQGWWRKHFKSGRPSELGHTIHNEVQHRIGESNWATWDLLCDIRKVETAA